jgi:hypothetical protein
MPYRISGQELIFKRWLTKKGIPFIREGCSLDTGGARRQYTPDFYLTALNVFIEIKPRTAAEETVFIEKAVEMNSPRMDDFSFFAVAFPGSANEPSSFKAFTADTGWVRDAETANSLFYEALGHTPSKKQGVSKSPAEPGRKRYQKPGKSSWDGVL